MMALVALVIAAPLLPAAAALDPAPGPGGHVASGAQAATAPDPRLVASPSTAMVEQAVTFDASGSVDPNGNVTSYYMDFGDGTVSGWLSEPTVDHVYSRPGDFTAHLLIVDDGGAVSHPSNGTTVRILPADGGDALSDPVETLVVLAVLVAFMALGWAYERRRVARGKGGHGEGPAVEVGPAGTGPTGQLGPGDAPHSHVGVRASATPTAGGPDGGPVP